MRNKKEEGRKSNSQKKRPFVASIPSMPPVLSSFFFSQVAHKTQEEEENGLETLAEANVPLEFSREKKSVVS